MCGITGIFNLDNELISSDVLQKMTDSLSHRGPDGEGLFRDKHIGLGHRRLAILDLSQKGHQPMMTSNKRYIISYNGEIYNYLSLKTELESFGYHFQSNTDTEVILTAYSKWGKDCLSKFNGMFAFAIWDSKKKELFLARDRYGIKPLYYTKKNNIFLFASEIKAFLAHPSYKVEVDQEGLLEYMTFQNFISEKTLYKNVFILPAGSFLKINLYSKDIKIKPYWDFYFQSPNKVKDEREYLEELDRLFVQAVNRQLISDVEVGSYLSGGMDSGSISAIASKKIVNMKTFTVGFDIKSASQYEITFDERENALKLSKLFKTDHHDFLLKAQDMQKIIKSLSWHIEEPRVGQCYPNYYAAKLASKYVKVVLSGTGGDELFCGYPWRYYNAIFGSRFNEYKDHYYSFWQRLIPPYLVNETFEPIWDEIKHINTKEIFENIFKNHANKKNSHSEQINHCLYFEAKTFLHGLLLIEDKISMAHGLETRVPFLDNDLVDFAQTLPINLKIKNLDEALSISRKDLLLSKSKFYNKTNDGKIILRKMMGKYIPKLITNGIKQGFSAPDATWFQKENRDYLQSLLFTENAKIYKFLKKNIIHQLINEHFDNKINNRLLIWSLINLENWMKLFL